MMGCQCQRDVNHLSGGCLDSRSTRNHFSHLVIKAIRLSGSTSRAEVPIIHLSPKAKLIYYYNSPVTHLSSTSPLLSLPSLPNSPSPNDVLQLIILLRVLRVLFLPRHHPRFPFVRPRSSSSITHAQISSRRNIAPS